MAMQYPVCGWPMRSSESGRRGIYPGRRGAGGKTPGGSRTGHGVAAGDPCRRRVMAAPLGVAAGDRAKSNRPVP